MLSQMGTHSLLCKFSIIIFLNKSIININYLQVIMHINPYPAKLIYLKLCLATATHTFKWLKITHICFIGAQLFANFRV